MTKQSWLLARRILRTRGTTLWCDRGLIWKYLSNCFAHLACVNGYWDTLKVHEGTYRQVVLLVVFGQFTLWRAYCRLSATIEIINRMLLKRYHSTRFIAYWDLKSTCDTFKIQTFSIWFWWGFVTRNYRLAHIFNTVPTYTNGALI